MALPFDELTRRGRGQRLLSLARQVIEGPYGLTGAIVRVLSVHSFNSMFRVDCADGRRLVLRVGDQCRIHAVGVEDVEAAWLNRLADQGTLTAPRPVPTSDGSWWTTASHPDIPSQRICSLFTWLGGRPVVDTVDRNAMRAVGRTLALLHEREAADGAEPGALMSSITANRPIYFHEIDLVTGYGSSHGSLFVEAIERVQQTLDQLWAAPPHRPHLLHGDLGPHNVMRRYGDYQPIDFQDLQFGFEVQDLGISLTDIGHRRPELTSAFRDGYAEARPLPDGLDDLLPTLAAARCLNIMNLGLHLQRAGISDSLDDHARRIADWMQR